MCVYVHISICKMRVLAEFIHILKLLKSPKISVIRRLSGSVEEICFKWNPPGNWSLKSFLLFTSFFFLQVERRKTTKYSPFFSSIQFFSYYYWLNNYLLSHYYIPGTDKICDRLGNTISKIVIWTIKSEDRIILKPRTV